MGKKKKKKQLAPAEPLTSKEESMAENRSDQSSDDCEKRIFSKISRELSICEFFPFGIKLGLSMNELRDLERESIIYRYGDVLMNVRMLEKWKSKTNPDEDHLVPLLAKALRNVDRQDIAYSIYHKFQRGSQRTLKDLQIEMQETLKDSYRHFMVQRFPWLQEKYFQLEELYVELTMTRKNKIGEKEIGIEEIFEEIESEIPQRILIEGQPGYGKTTLVMKLLSDWKVGERYISDRFRLVFVIPLRNFKGDLSFHFLQQCERVEGSEDVKLKAIKAIEERVLLLLDGLDEIPTGDKEKLYRLFKGEDYPQMTVVVTCRTGFLPKVKSLDNMFDAFGNKGLEMDFVWDKRVEIHGISFEERKHFIQKYLNINYEELKEKIDEIDFLWDEMYACPLFLLLLAVLLQEQDIRPIKTKTKLYETIFNFVINRGLVKLKVKCKEINVFDLTTETDGFGCRKLLINFGELCLEKVKERSLIFEERELLKCSNGNGDRSLILKLGFLSKQISFSNYEEKEHYEPIHRSFLEFSAAFFLSSFGGMEKEIQEMVGNFHICPNRDQLLYPFLGGLLHRDAFKLFNALSRYKYLISVFSVTEGYSYTVYNVEEVLLEIFPTEEILESLKNLLIGDWEGVKYNKFLHRWFVGLLENFKEWDGVISLNISKHLHVINDSSDIKVNTIRANVEESVIKIRGRNIQCRNLIITIKKHLKNSGPILKEIITKIKAEKIWLEITFPSLKTDEEISNENTGDLITFFEQIFDFSHFNFHHLSLKRVLPSVWCRILPYILNSIKHGKIEFSISIEFEQENSSFKNEFSSFVEIVFNSHLQSFSVDNLRDKEPLPFPRISFDDERHMQLISFKGKFEERNLDEMKSISVEQLECEGFIGGCIGFNGKFLNKCKHVKRLSCDEGLISSLGDDDSFHEWEGFETVVQLDINKCSIRNTASFLKGIALFRNVQELDLDNYGMGNEVIIEFIAVLPSLKKIRFSHADIRIIKQLLVLNEQRGERGLSLDELEIFSFGSSTISSMDFIKCIEECFLKNVFFLFSVASHEKFEIQKFFKHFISKDEFKISSLIVEKSSVKEIMEFPNVKFCLQKLK